MANWYPQNPDELNTILSDFLSNKESSRKNIHGLVVPHAGYEFSGKIAGKAFSLLKNNKINKAIILGPSHYSGFRGIKSLKNVKTPLGKIKIPDNEFKELDYEHSVENQIPFLQKLNFKKVLPLVVGEISNAEAKQIAEYLSKEKAVYIFSTDLSHFFPYDVAVKKDNQSIKIIENLDIEAWDKIDACGKYPLLIMMHLCRIKNWKLGLVEYKNSGDVTGDKNRVVGYASFFF
ncbi:MAG: AmmeMemoRadiSam system protein B [Nanoarchaeota archaeon]|nr:AmmeMemoRadiSam system protein B [Nanoarchaeota archaeon]MBU4116583.1 AmmeMemoRadiSam system protein B [Nanoarchaeota archaeon]